MSIIQGNAHTSAGGGGFQIGRSLRFNSADTAYLNRTPASASNRRTWTWSGWVKQGLLGIDSALFDAANNDQFRFRSDNTFSFSFNNTLALQTTQVFRDPSAWYHIIVAVDTTQATSSNRIKIYINGVQITAFSTASYPAQNTDGFINSTNAHSVGRTSGGAYYFNGYMTEVNFIDGQALTPSSFGETDSNTGVWKPKAYTGTYGTNGFYVNFSDNSNTTAATLGKDTSGNGNNWTPNNFSVTAGSGNDSLVDSPTSYGTDTGVGGTVRGNYCTWNALSTGRTLSNGNLDYAGSASGVAKGTLGVSSGKWYWEILANGANSSAGVASVSLNPTTSYCGSTADSWCLFTSGDRYNNGSATSGYSTFTTNDIISIALDMDNGKVYWAKNGVWQGSSDPVTGTNAGYTNLSGYTITPANGNNNVNDLGTANFGQRAFAYTAPSGFKALCTQNLPTPTIGATSTTQANDYMNVVLWTGDGTSTRSITGVGFQPDWVWIKSRNNAITHRLSDAVRGANKVLYSNLTNAEDTNDNNGYTSSFNSDGFTLTAGATNSNATNASTYTYVGWNWKANGAGSSNTAGTITSTVSANTTAGFSISTYTGNGSSSQTVGHGLGVAPGMVIIKTRSNSDNWRVWHTSLTSGQTLTLNSTAGQAAAGFWPSSPSTSVVYLGTDTSVNSNTWTYVMYSFAPVAGYSAFGSYVGNSSADGPFVYLGFRPAYIMVKRFTSTGIWEIIDAKRDPYNAADKSLRANASDAETAGVGPIDFLSNGFKLRGTGGNTNDSGTYLYAAFAENPFKYSLAR